MPELFEEISRLTAALQEVEASTLQSEHLSAVLQKLQANQLGAAVTEYSRKLPVEPDDDWEKDRYRKEIAIEADRVNHAAEKFLHELERIKRIRQTLNLDALDPIIREARTIIHKLHDFTARLQGG